MKWNEPSERIVTLRCFSLSFANDTQLWSTGSSSFGSERTRNGSIFYIFFYSFFSFEEKKILSWLLIGPRALFSTRGEVKWNRLKRIQSCVVYIHIQYLYEYTYILITLHLLVCDSWVLCETNGLLFGHEMENSRNACETKFKELRKNSAKIIQ